MTIKVLGPGCMNCATLEKRVRRALEELGMDASVEKINDEKIIAAYGILRTPGLIIDGSVVLSGSVPRIDEIKEILRTRVTR